MNMTLDALMIELSKLIIYGGLGTYIGFKIGVFKKNKIQKKR